MGTVLTIAVTHFWAGPGREHDAALAWAFELTHYFKRGVGEAPIVTALEAWPTFEMTGHRYYGRGWYAFARRTGDRLYLNFWETMPHPAELVIYQCRGLMSTTHPSDTQPECVFDSGGAWSLDDASDPRRRERLLGLSSTGPRWDGRE